jgi:hypothetical protein
MATITVARSIHFTLSLHIKEGNKQVICFWRILRYNITVAQ